MKPSLLSVITEYFTVGTQVMNESAPQTIADNSEGDDEVVTKIKELLETRVQLKIE